MVCSDGRKSKKARATLRGSGESKIKVGKTEIILAVLLNVIRKSLTKMNLKTLFER